MHLNAASLSQAAAGRRKWRDRSTDVTEFCTDPADASDDDDDDDDDAEADDDADADADADDAQLRGLAF